MSHSIEITPNPNRILVRWAGEVVADTTRALNMKEASYPVVHYIPREDVAMDKLTGTAHQTHCPYKGDASYFSILAKGQTTENAVWSYETPLPSVSAIAGYVAFYGSRVDGIEEIP